MAYEYVKIPLGLSLAPRVFNKCVEGALSPLRNAGIRVLSYLDDLLVCMPFQWQVERDTNMLVTHLMNLGFNRNQIKCCLIPSQKIV